ncbi:3343_t:CDS:2 [Diversispora eburnea]|uniref:3343_t:CDS:1 n=1 Tax=Diversispora eburnea TaxID=1213867 RepID=A0A9N8ZPN8_9GLOM|nr:3343_t:CDS:2 [Diversispora eburnea]
MVQNYRTPTVVHASLYTLSVGVNFPLQELPTNSQAQQYIDKNGLLDLIKDQMFANTINVTVSPPDMKCLFK